MATTIHHMAYKMSVNNARFNAGMTASRKELRDSKAIMRDMRGPVAQLEDDLAQLHGLYGKGLITLDAYNRKKKQLSKEMRTAQRASSKLSGLMSKGFSAGMYAGAAAVGAVVAGLETMRRLVNAQFPILDKLAKKSDEIGISPEMLRRLEASAELTTTFNADQFDTALRKMTVRISQAAAGTGEAVASLEELNLNAEYLNTLSPDQQYLAIADAMSMIDNEADQARIVMKLFDDEAVALVNNLRMGSDEILAQTGHMKTHSREGLAMVESANDAWKRLGQTTNSLFEKMAVDFSPMVQLLAEDLMGVAESNPMDAFLDASLAVAEDVLPVLIAGFHELTAIVTDAAIVATKLQNLPRKIPFIGDSFTSSWVDYGIDKMERSAIRSREMSSIDYQRERVSSRLDEIRQAAEERANALRERQANAAERTAAALENGLEQTANAGSF